MITFIITSVVFGGGLGFFVWFNWDYIVFKVLIAGSYVYTDTLDTMYENALGEKPTKGYYKNFDDVVISVVTEKIRVVGGDRYTYLYTPPQLALSKENTKAQADEQHIDLVDENTVYVRLPNISPYTRLFLYDNRKLLGEYKNIVIDVRSNPGGTLKDVYAMCDLFLERGAKIAAEKTRLWFMTRDITAGGVLTSKKCFDFENIVFLQNGDTASAAETLIMALKENLPNVTTIGTTTFGKGIGQMTLEIRNGFAVKATTMRLETPSGASIHRIGIPADLEHNPDDEGIVEFAAEYLRGK